MSERSSLEAVWAEIHSFTVDQNSRSASKTRSNRRSISLTLPITLLLAIIILMGSWLWLWLLGGGVLWLLYKMTTIGPFPHGGGKRHRLAFKARDRQRPRGDRPSS